ncbi:MAG TPA: hypothetical protein VLQ45_22795, partial [Thermoanaerobaculia bacterium]|nr:hypothetical protein [Thermoanaerobaculia bacterium]
HVPGERLGRLSLGSTAFASALVGEGPEREAEGRVARLAVASSEGVLRLLTIHYPKYTELRQSQFRKIWQTWMEILHGGGDAGQGGRGHLLRRAEALYAAAPHLSAVMVRWILWPDSGGARGDLKPWSERAAIRAEAPGPGRQWMPRHFQPLIDLDAAWAELRQARTEKERHSLAARLSESFTEALRAARDVRDSRLFKEILEVTLNRANHQLFRQMREVTRALKEKRKPAEIHAEWFLALLNCLMDIKGAWLGAPEGIDTRMRVVIVRNLVDGDTLWSLSEALRHARGDLREEIEWIIERRIQQIHEFLAKGDPLLALEVLRAVNLSLARACRRLDPKEELASKTIEGYYETVGDFASRAVHSTRNELGEALAHEICRTYALGMLACSSSTLRLTHRMSEADLPPDFARQTFLQFSLFPKLLGRPMSAERLRIFRIGSGLGAQDGKIGDESFLSRRSWEQGSREPGKDNRGLVKEGEIFDEIVHWIHDLADRFANRPESVDLEPAAKYQSRCKRPKKEDPFRHSRMFWSQALQDFCALCEAGGFPFQGDGSSARGSSENVRPDLVLLSKTLSTWCEDQQRKLNAMKREYKIFDPQRALYNQALSALAEATGEFREGVSLQKNIVQGVLSHGLLEMLDEHLLGLWEVAQALDPEQTWKRSEQKREEGNGAPKANHRQRRSRAARFADAMLDTALKAEVIPKNLRNLQWLLSYDSQNIASKGAAEEPATEAAGGRSSLRLTELLAEFTDEEYGWKVDALEADVELELRESHFLRFILNELADNQGHNGTIPLASPVAALKDESPYSIRLVFSCHSSKEDRIDKLRKADLQQPIPPDPTSFMRSHGMGLYLANLAAGAVGWKLTIEDSKDPERIPFVLSRRG